MEILSDEDKLKILPDETMCKILNLENAIKYLSDVIDFLEKIKIADEYNIYNLILRISNAFYDYYNKFIDKVCYEFKKRNLVNLIHFFLQNQNKISSQKENTIYLMYIILANFSEHDYEFAGMLESSNTINYIIDKYLQFDSSNIKNCKENKNFKSLITIIHNFASHKLDKINYRVDEIKKTFLDIVNLNCDDYYGLISLVTLSYLIDENEINLFDGHENIVKELIKKIKLINENKLRSEGFTVKELIHGLRRLSANDEIKTIIDTENGIQVLIDILNSTNNENVIEPTLDVIKQLCFNNDIKIKLINHYKIGETLTKFANHSNAKICQHYNGILWILDNKLESLPKGNTEKTAIVFDAFMSYSWANKDKVLEICSILKSYNVNVWIDREEMISSTLEAMATGIENSKVVVIAASTAYKNSSNCRLEAEYAQKIKKPIIPLVMEHKYKPSNWLGILFGTKVYIEFSDRRNANEQVQQLIKNIKFHLNRPVKLAEKIDLNAGEKNRSNSRTRIVLVDEVKNWSCENVGDWLDKFGIGYLKEKFIGVDGSMIEVMLDIRMNSGDYFNNCLKNEFKMNFIEVVKFHKALNDLIVF